MTSPTGCSTWLYIAVVVGILTCLIDRNWAEPVNFRGFYGWRLFISIVIIVLGIICFLR